MMALYWTFLLVAGVWGSSPPPVDVDIDRMVGRFYVVRIRDSIPVVFIYFLLHFMLFSIFYFLALKYININRNL